MTTMQRWEGRGGMTILCFLTCFVTQTSLLYKVITWEFWKNYIMFRRHLKTFIGSWRKQKLRLTQNWLLWCALIFVIGSPQRHLETIFASVQTLTKTPEICFHFHFFQQPICLFIFLIKKNIYTYIYILSTCAEKSTINKTDRNGQIRKTIMKKNVTCRVFLVLCHESCVLCCVSRVACHLWPVTCHRSPVTCH